MDYEDMSTTAWRDLGVEHGQWLDTLDGKSYRKDFLQVCKNPAQTHLVAVEFGKEGNKKVQISLRDALDSLLLNSEVNTALIQCLQHSTCTYTEVLRHTLANQYEKDLRTL